MNLLKSSTVTQIVRVKDSEMLPAVGELTTADEEQFPIFDAAILKLAKHAQETGLRVLLRLNRGAGTPRGYVRDIAVVDIASRLYPCPDCLAAEIWHADIHETIDVRGSVDDYLKILTTKPWSHVKVTPPEPKVAM